MLCSRGMLVLRSARGIFASLMGNAHCIRGKELHGVYWLRFISLWHRFFVETERAPSAIQRVMHTHLLGAGCWECACPWTALRSPTVIHTSSPSGKSYQVLLVSGLWLSSPKQCSIFFRHNVATYISPWHSGAAPWGDGGKHYKRPARAT